MVSGAEVARRVWSRSTHRVVSLPILALNVHSACNCRCVMCDIWKANAEKREISAADLDAHMDAVRRLHVERVMLTGGEPLLHRNLWRLCERLRAADVRITLVTTGLLLAPHADAIASLVDELVVSIDGAPAVHDDIRQVAGAFARIEKGVALLNNHATRPRTIARSVVQRRNHARLVETIGAVAGVGIDRLSFLAADVSSTAFNRPQPWSVERVGEVALSREQVFALTAAIDDVADRCGDVLDSGFVVGGLSSLRRIRDYYAALNGLGAFPPVACNAPWVSAVLEADGRVRPCFFHPVYPAAPGAPLDEVINSAEAVAFRRSLRTKQNETCRRCVCALWLPAHREV